MTDPHDSPIPAVTGSTLPRPDHATAARLLAGLAAASDGADQAPAEPLRVLPQMALARGRVHEVAGPARRTLAAVAAGVAQAEGPVLWLRPGWRAEGLCPQGLMPLVADPGALMMVRCPRPVDVLWSMEEALRAGCVALVIAEIAEPPDLRQVRRLHLAASDGLARNRAAGRGALAPLGVMLGHEVTNARIAGVESRWALHPLPPEGGWAGHGAPRWRLDRQLARGLPPKDWEVRLADMVRAAEAGKASPLMEHA